MANWFVIKDDIIIDFIIADSKEYVENSFSAEALEDDGIKSIGWTRASGIWQAPYPVDGLEYTWDIELNQWSLVPLTILEDTFIIEE
jgi:hypothetical protein